MSASEPKPCYQRSGDSLVVTVHVTPGARRTAIGGLFASPGAPALQMKVAAPPVDGKANAAVAADLAKALGLPRRAVALVGGAHARLKRLRLDGDPAALARKLDALAAGA